MIFVRDDNSRRTHTTVGKSTQNKKKELFIDMLVLTETKIALHSYCAHTSSCSVMRNNCRRHWQRVSQKDVQIFEHDEEWC